MIVWHLVDYCGYNRVRNDILKYSINKQFQQKHIRPTYKPLLLLLAEMIWVWPVFLPTFTWPFEYFNRIIDLSLKSTFSQNSSEHVEQLNHVIQHCVSLVELLIQMAQKWYFWQPLYALKSHKKYVANNFWIYDYP